MQILRKLTRSGQLASFGFFILIHSGMVSANLLCNFSCSGQNDAIQLVTPQEMALEAKLPELPAAKSISIPAANAPIIQLLAPNLMESVATPFPIQLRFQAAGDARIVPETFKVLWGRLGIDITKRVLEKSPVSESGLRLSNAKVPSGTHRLKISIADDKNRIGELAVTLEVKE